MNNNQAVKAVESMRELGIISEKAFNEIGALVAKSLAGIISGGNQVAKIFEGLKRKRIGGCGKAYQCDQRLRAARHPRRRYKRRKQNRIMTEIAFAVEPDIECGYRAKAIGHAIFTQGDTIEKVKTMVSDAVLCHFGKAEMRHSIKLTFPLDEQKPNTRPLL